MSKREKFEVGNQVRVAGDRGHKYNATIYEITKIFPNGNCLIREEGTAPNGKPYAEQLFDVSLLKHAVTNEMLKAFSIGGLKAVRRTR